MIWISFSPSKTATATDGVLSFVSSISPFIFVSTSALSNVLSALTGIDINIPAITATAMPDKKSFFLIEIIPPHRFVIVSIISYGNQ